MKKFIVLLMSITGLAQAQIATPPPTAIPCKTTVINPYLCSEDGSGINADWDMEPANRIALCDTPACVGQHYHRWAVDNLNAYDCYDPNNEDCDDEIGLCVGCEDDDIYQKHIAKCERDHQSPGDNVVYNCCEYLLLYVDEHPAPLEGICYASLNGNNDVVLLYTIYINTNLLWNQDECDILFATTPREPLTDWQAVWVIKYTIKQFSTYPENQRVEYTLSYIRMDSSPEGSYLLYQIDSDRNCVNSSNNFIYEFDGDLTYQSAPISIDVSLKCETWCQIVN